MHQHEERVAGVSAPGCSEAFEVDTDSYLFELVYDGETGSRVIGDDSLLGGVSGELDRMDNRPCIADYYGKGLSASAGTGLGLQGRY